MIDQEKGDLYPPFQFKPDFKLLPIENKFYLTSAKKRLNEECLKEILASCSKYDYLGFSDSTDSAPKIIEISVPSLYDSDIK